MTTATLPAALVTRPRQDSDKLAEALSKRGYRPLIEPLLQIRVLPGPKLSRKGVQALLATSANGLRALATRLGDGLGGWQDLPVWAVGDATAAVARKLGFQTVTSAEGNAAALAVMVAARVNPKSGRLLHVAANQVAGDLGGALGRAGFGVDQVILYDAEPVTALSPALAQELQQGQLALALFFSPRTASTFVRLAIAQNLAESCRTVRAFGLSPAVTKALAGLPWWKVTTSERPLQASMLAALDGV